MWVLDTVVVTLTEVLPKQAATPREIPFSEKEKLAIDSELTKLLKQSCNRTV